jgi:hypothetical protein
MAAKDTEYIREMTLLREEVLLRKGLCYFLLPCFLIGLIAFWSPFVYVMIPVHESDMCICSYYWKMYCTDKEYFFLNSNQ